MSALQVTVFAKREGLLTKRISLGPDGGVKSDGSACVTSAGTARRFVLDGVGQLAGLIGELGPSEAIALGTLRDDLPGEVGVVPKRRLNGASDVIARSQDYIALRAGAPALALVDFDMKGMPAAIAARIEKEGGFWPALVSVLPALARVPRVERRSTTAGLFRTDTGKPLDGSGGWHVYLLVQDGADGERFPEGAARALLARRIWLDDGRGRRPAARTLHCGSRGRRPRAPDLRGSAAGRPASRAGSGRAAGRQQSMEKHSTPQPPARPFRSSRRPGFTSCAPRKRTGSRPKPPTPAPTSSSGDPNASRNALAWTCVAPAERSRGNARASCCQISCCPSMTKSWPARPSATCWRIPRRLRASRSPTRSKVSTMV